MSVLFFRMGRFRRRMWWRWRRWAYSPWSTRYWVWERDTGHLRTTWTNRYFRGRNWTRPSKLWYVRYQSELLCNCVSCFENITRALDQNPGVCPDLTQENTKVNYFLSIFTEKTLEIIQDQTNLYAVPECERRLGGQALRMVGCNWKPTTLQETDICYSTYVDGYSHAAGAETLLVYWTTHLCSGCC